MVVQLAISVPLANILLWTFTEAFIVLMSFHATRLFARYLLDRRLCSGHRVPLIPARSLVDLLPYNSDLSPLPRRHKLALTLVRFVGVAISVYVGAALDGAVAPSDRRFDATTATGIATEPGAFLTHNSGADIPAMAKLSCLRIVDNDHVVLFRGFVAGEHILCEDGVATYSEHTLAHARIRADYPTGDEGLDLSDINLARAPDQDGLTVGKRAIRFARRVDGEDDESIRIVLLHRDAHNCTFGVRRSVGSGFDIEVDLKLIITCDVMVVEFQRMLAAKPGCLPPRISFLHQTLDAVVISQEVRHAPMLKSDNVQATLTLGGVVTGAIGAGAVTIASVVLWMLIRASKVKKDLTCIRGLAEMWGEEKFGTSRDGVFVALAGKNGGAYLGTAETRVVGTDGWVEDNVTWSGTSGDRWDEADVGIEEWDMDLEDNK